MINDEGMSNSAAQMCTASATQFDFLADPFPYSARALLSTRGTRHSLFAKRSEFSLALSKWSRELSKF